MRGNKGLLLFAGGVMDLSWYFAWATFITTSVLHRPFPFPESVGAFALAAALTHFSYGRGWRIIQIAALQTLFFVPLLLRIVHIFNSWSDSFAQQTWLTQSFYYENAAQQWFVFMLLILWIFPFWGGGIRLVRREADYLTVCSRFDRGLVAFFVLLLAKFMFTQRGNINIEGTVFESLLITFFIFSLLAIGLVRNRETKATKDFIPGYRGIGVIMGFTVVILLLCTGITLFFMPYLTAAAKTGFGILKSAAQPVGSLLIIIFHFIFGGPEDWKGEPPEKTLAKPQKLGSSGTHSWWWELFGTILAWIAWILLASVILLILGLSLYFFVQWLFSKTEIYRDDKIPSRPLPPWAKRLQTFFLSCWKIFVRVIGGYSGVVQIYAALQKWGKRSGISRIISETPREYGLRLESRFPVLKEEIGFVIEAFNQEVYGGIALSKQKLSMTCSAWSRLHSPRHWPRRLKTWFLRNQEQPNPFR